MAFSGETVEVILGERGLNATGNSLRIEDSDLIVASCIKLEDGLLSHDNGALVLDTGGTAPSNLTPVATMSGAVDALAAGVTHCAAVGSAALAYRGSLGTSSGAGSATTTALTTTTNTAAVGDFVVVGFGCTNTGGTITSAVDSVGNTYTRGFPHAGATPGFCGLLWAVVTVAMPPGTVITVTHGASSNRAIAADAFSGTFDSTATPSSTYSNNADTGAAWSLGATLDGLRFPSVCVGIGVLDSSTGVTVTADTPWAKTNDVEIGTDVRLWMEYYLTQPPCVALYDWQSQEITGVAGVAAAAGTVTVVAGSTTVTGVGTAFTTSLQHGDRIRIGNEERVIYDVTSATVLLTTEPWLTAAAASAYVLLSSGRTIFATADGIIYKGKNGYVGSSVFGDETVDVNATSLATGNSKLARPGYFVPGGKEDSAGKRKLFYFNGMDAVLVLEGNDTAMAGLAAPAADWAGNNQPVAGVVHRYRLWGFGNKNHPHRLYGSDQADHETFTGVNSVFLNIGTQIGERIYAAASFQGLLWLAKWPRGLFWVDDSDALAANWSVRMKSEALGCAPSPFAFLPIDDDVLLFSSDGGIHLLTAIAGSADIHTSSLSDKLGVTKWIRENVNLSRLDQLVSVWYPQKRTAYFSVPGTGHSSNSLMMKIDFSEQALGRPPKFSYSSRDRVDALAIRRDSTGIERPIFAESNTIYMLDRATKTKYSQASRTTDAYTSSWQTPHLDFSSNDKTLSKAASLRHVKKRFCFLEMVGEPPTSGGGSITITTYVDRAVQDTLTFDSTRRRHRLRINGEGYTFSIAGTSSSADYQYASFIVSYERSGEDQRT